MTNTTCRGCTGTCCTGVGSEPCTCPPPAECWNAFCIATDCDGANHVDATGKTWAQQPGETYCVKHDEYDDCPDDGPVVTLYERADQGEPETTSQHDSHKTTDPNCRACAATADDRTFKVTDAMFAEALAKAILATQVVFYPSRTSKDGWDYEYAYSDPEAQRLAREIGPDAVVLDL